MALAFWPICVFSYIYCPASTLLDIAQRAKCADAMKAKTEEPTISVSMDVFIPMQIDKFIVSLIINNCL